MGLIRSLRRVFLRRRPFPPEWMTFVERYFYFFDRLAPDKQQRFLDMLKVFAWEKHFFGAGGLELTDEHRVVISGVAVRLVLHLKLSYYDRLTEIVVYPYNYRHPDDDGRTVTFGEAHSWGTVVLSWPAVVRGLADPCDGHDTAAHEFAHVLDRGSGFFDGTPRLRATEDYRAWGDVMSRHFFGLRAGALKEAFVLRGYGAKNEAEFFAVATESFFERPVAMRRLMPDLYEELSNFYGFDPAADPICACPDEDELPAC